MVKLRLQKTGNKNRPHFRIVAANIRSPRDGRFIELIGHYHPNSPATQQSILNEEKALSWLKKGAVPSDTVLSILKSSGIWSKFQG